MDTPVEYDQVSTQWNILNAENRREHVVLFQLVNVPVLCTVCTKMNPLTFITIHLLQQEHSDL